MGQNNRHSDLSIHYEIVFIMKSTKTGTTTDISYLVSSLYLCNRLLAQSEKNILP